MNLEHKALWYASGYTLFLGACICAVIVFARTLTVRAEGELAGTLPAEMHLSAPLVGRAAIVYDVRTDTIVYEKNMHASLPIASLTKVLTALTANEEKNPEQTVQISAQALRQEGDTGLFAHESWKLKDLIDFTLISSSNDGAAAIAAALSTSTSFTQKMNETAHKIGLTETYLLNATGLDLDLSTSGGYSSAYDFARLYAYILRAHPDLLEKTVLPEAKIVSQSGFTHTAKNTNAFVAREAGIIASKTGFTDLAGGNLAVAFDAGPLHPMIAVVLGSTERERFKDVHTLMELGLSYATHH